LTGCWKASFPWQGGDGMTRYSPFKPACIIAVWVLLVTLLATACSREGERVPTSGTTIVFKHGKIAGDYSQFRDLLDRFEHEHPGISVKDETLPASSDEQHQFYAINLEGKSAEFDVLSMDVIWVPEFAKAGWLRDVSHLLPGGEQKAFFPGPLEAVTTDGKLYAIPWYIDAGLLYYRKDLLAKYNRPVPRTWQELVKTAQQITEKEKDLYGYIWQGKQYEGLVCNVLEFFWSNGGSVLSNGKPVLDSKENVEALAFMRDLIAKYNVSPPLVTTAIEEPTRHLFGSGKALFMRNWPYAWNIFNREGSAVRGKTGVAPLPSFPGHESASTLGGWQLGVNCFSRNPEAAEELVRFLTSPASQKTLALTIGYKPTRKALYKDRDLIREQPFMTSLFGVFMKARPRPVTPYYMMITQVLQPEFSAAISGIKTPEQSLTSAQKQVEHILGAGP
jgi:multiple sugar transport system substrate-binding protein